MSFTLSGYKTYISGIIVVLSSIAFAFGMIDLATFLKLAGFFGGLEGMAIKSAINKQVAK